jgi:HD-GYP domain-containing protein (c-di-GMP phosphodiesterase class II)
VVDVLWQIRTIEQNFVSSRNQERRVREIIKGGLFVKLSIREKIEPNGLIIISFFAGLIYWVFDSQIPGQIIIRVCTFSIFIVYGIFNQKLINTHKTAVASLTHSRDTLEETVKTRTSELIRANEEILQNIDRLRKTLGSTIQALADTVEARDPYTAGHQRRVSDLARAIATEMCLAAEQINGIRMASVIHDIGKISVPADILSKPARLSNMELNLIKQHSESGYGILKDIDFMWPVAQIVLQHHERIDGSGYPRGLKSENMLMEAKILAVADVVEAIASHRPYRPALGIDAALEEIMQNKGIFYDEAVVDACLRLFRGKGYQLKNT